MEVIELSLSESSHFPKLDDVSIAVGYFDGIHKGHQAVIQTAIEQANELNIKSGVMTFSPHPLTVIKGEPLSDYLITSLDEKLDLFKSMDLDYVIIVTFDRDLAKLSPQSFVDQFFSDLNVKHVVGGFDFSFGHKGAGKIQEMESYSKGRFTHSVVDQVSLKNEKVSSTLIREQLSLGNLKYTEQLLGRPFTIKSKVKEGYKRGREIGFPTANLDVDPEHKVPRVGVYVVQIEYADKVYGGMASVGYNPTFENEHDKPIIEVNIFDFDQNLYGEEIIVSFMNYIRDEEKFDNVDTLVDRIKQDEIEAKKILSKYR
ncbi:riboflavin kinase/FMN adenylyltransferase [Alkalibacillus filiformis]|uniref:Riboflavin biosynthesis protein n=1 Tax=Alkalibacillus filiformis TaxID=200990 RepID=A0ABU0DQF3_9BACI|nr:bifunctional riboflavin kinase/FAD synthetase [Alkalibacillus filiformis]MDQ0350669.1 riboflavin kinase/FMN adenylyltransferase [Alkalibacillus filiformis]